MPVQACFHPNNSNCVLGNISWSAHHTPAAFSSHMCTPWASQQLLQQTNALQKQVLGIHACISGIACRFKFGFICGTRCRSNMLNHASYIMSFKTIVAIKKNLFELETARYHCSFAGQTTLHVNSREGLPSRPHLNLIMSAQTGLLPLVHCHAIASILI